MAELFHKTFSDAITGANGFDSVSAVNGTIEQSAGAGLNGTTGGALYTRTSSSPAIYGVLGHVLNGLSAFRTAFFLDLASYTIATDTHFGLIWSPRNGAAGGVVASLLVVNAGGQLYMHCRKHDDGASTVVEAVSLATLPAWIEVEIIRETTDGANNGELRFYFGGGDYPGTGTQVAEFLNCQNYINFNAMVNARFGMVTGSSSVAGTLKIDEIIARNDDTPILFGVSESTTPPYLYLRRRRRD